MATTTAFTSLSVPVPDDSMEMSSPANPPVDEDIDIDFDEYEGGVHVISDEHMLEDGETRPGTGTDDMMEDDLFPAEATLATEEVMQDEGVHIPDAVQDEDDELIDYGDDDFLDHSVEDTVLPNALEEPAIIPSLDAPQVDEEQLALNAPAAIAAPTAAVRETVFEVTQTQNESIPGEPSPLPAVVEEESAVSPDLAFPQTAGSEHEGHEVADNNPQHIDVPINTAVSTEDNTPGTPTDTGLHPMSVRYKDVDLPLFKSRHQPDGLLKDDNLASLSLAELMKNCRQRLAIKTGEDLSEDQELLLSFDGMGLLLVEDSRAAFESSLNDILEVYVQLHRNDGVEEVPHLLLILSSQLKFASSFSILKHAASSGQGISTFGFLQPAGDHDYYQEQYQNAENADFFGDEHGDSSNQAEHDDTADGEHQAYEHTTEDDHTHAHTDGHLEEEEYYEEEDAYQEHSAKQADQSDRAQLQNRAEEIAASYVSHDNTEDTAAGLQSEQPTGEKAGSTASSTTITGDVAVDSAVLPPDGNDDSSTFLTELDDEDEAAIAKGVPQTLDKSAAAKKTPVVPADECIVETNDDQQNLGSEDFLYDFGEPEDEGRQGHENQGHGSADPSADHAQIDGGEEQEFDQADRYDEQQEEYHPGYEPGADEDEQFHTAQDFLNGDYYEHGPEHDHGLQDEEEGLDDSIDTVLHHPVKADPDGIEAEQDIEDDLDFGEETFELEDGQDQQEQQQPLPGSLHGKRSFEEHHADDDDFLEDDERDPKKVRAT